MGGAVICFQFPGHSKDNLRNLAVNMTPFYWSYFFMIGFALLTSHGSEHDFMVASWTSNMVGFVRARNSMPSDFPRTEMC